MKYFNQESERLRYRKLTKNDISSWVEFFEKNDRLHFLGLDLTKTKDVLAKDWIIRQLERYEEQGLGLLAVEIKENGKLIGMGGIIPRELNGKSEHEIAYSLKPEFWKKGYGTEIAKQMKRFGFKNIETNRFISIIHIENTDSIHVAKKNGMNVLFRTEFMGMNVDIYGIKKNKTV